MKKIVILGHVDHGKSTILGRLLADTHVLPKGKLQALRNNCRNNAKTFEYSFLIDAFKLEQDQGITLDIARCFFKYKNAEYLFFDAPGHLEFLKNAITGAFQADNAIVVIDVQEGIQENSRRHAYLLSMMNMENVIVVLNKMDLANYDQNIYEETKREYQKFLLEHNISGSIFIPACGLKGENIAKKSLCMPWYTGKTLLEALRTFKLDPLLESKPFRLPVQDIYKFTEKGDSRRIIAGFVEYGQCKGGDKLRFFPSNKEASIISIEDFPNKSDEYASSGMSAGLVLHPQIYIKRGEVAAKVDEKQPEVASRIKVRFFCFSPTPLEKGKTYVLKICTAKVSFTIEKICSVLDTATFQYQEKDCIEQNDVAECILSLNSPIAFDIEKEMFHTGRFVIVHEFAIIGGGVICEKLDPSNKQAQKESALEDFICPLQFFDEEKSQKAVAFIVFGEDPQTRIVFAQNFRKFLAEKKCPTTCLEIDCSLLHSTKELKRCEEAISLLLAASTTLLFLIKGASSDKLMTLLNRKNLQNVVIDLNKEKSLQLQADYHIVSFDNIPETFEKIYSEGVDGKFS